MAARANSKASDWLQIVILALFFTSALLAMAALVFYLLIPSRVSASEGQTRDFQKLITDFRGQDYKSARDNFLQLRQQSSGVNIKEILNAQLLDIQPSLFPFTNEKKLGGSTTAYRQEMRFQGVNLQSVIDFVARVRQAHRGIHVADVRLERKARSSGSEGKDWNAHLEFVLFQNDEVMRNLAPAASPAKTTTGEARPAPAPASALAAPTPELSEEKLEPSAEAPATGSTAEDAAAKKP